MEDENLTPHFIPASVPYIQVLDILYAQGGKPNRNGSTALLWIIYYLTQP